MINEIYDYKEGTKYEVMKKGVFGGTGISFDKSALPMTKVLAVMKLAPA